MIKKTPLKTWCIANFYKYAIFEVDAGGLSWLEAVPTTPGLVTRSAENECILRILLENDCASHNKFIQKVR